MPIPQLNVRAISASWMPPWRCSQSKIGGIGQRARSRRALVPCGSTRGMFSVRPPPVMWARPFTAISARSASTGFT
jgi:hypothetical protein